ncbi:hypothetical protein KSP40_PGU010158 [Platanthera guangdongensis]|uniref:Uncharacterized protein n=1 Tax=Platanthera guangdongensis TaxID=2320717 RepID=A0ABR2MIS4_9ASPA
MIPLSLSLQLPILLPILISFLLENMLLALRLRLWRSLMLKMWTFMLFCDLDHLKLSTAPFMERNLEF